MNSSFAPFGPRTRNSEMINCAAATCARPSTISTRPASITEARNDFDMPVISFLGWPTMFSRAKKTSTPLAHRQRNLHFSFLDHHGSWKSLYVHKKSEPARLLNSQKEVHRYR